MGHLRKMGMLMVLAEQDEYCSKEGSEMEGEAKVDAGEVSVHRAWAAVAHGGRQRDCGEKWPPPVWIEARRPEKRKGESGVVVYGRD